MDREIWVDAHRYLPLRMVEKLARIDYEWLPYDEKLLWPDLPPGLRRVEAPPAKEKDKPVRSALPQDRVSRAPCSPLKPRDIRSARTWTHGCSG